MAYTATDRAAIAPVVPLVEGDLNWTTGEWIAGWPHVVQSIGDIIATARLTRVMRRWYGSDCGKLIDALQSPRVLLAWFVAVSSALDEFEPRFELTKIGVTTAGADGRVEIELRGLYYPNGHRGDRTTVQRVDDVRLWM